MNNPNSLLDKQDPMSELSHMTPEESNEYNAYLDEQRRQEELIDREHPLSAREQSYLSADEAELYQRWLKQPLTGHDKINFKAALKAMQATRQWLNKMNIFEEILAETKQTETYQKWAAKQSLLEEVTGPRLAWIKTPTLGNTFASLINH